MAQQFAKVDAGLDSNPKIRRAGRNGREVFMFVLRRVSALDAQGSVSSENVEPWYLADALMTTEAEAADGVARAIAAKLLTVADGVVTVVGWNDDWGKRPMTEAERKAASREKAKAIVAFVTTPMPIVTESDTSLDVTIGHDAIVTCPDSHALEKSREEETRVEEKRVARAAPRAKPTGDHAVFIASWDSRWQRIHGVGVKPTWNGRTAKIAADLLRQHGLDELLRRIAILDDSPPPWPAGTWDLATFSQHIDKLASPTCATAPRSFGMSPSAAAFADVERLQREEDERTALASGELQ